MASEFVGEGVVGFDGLDEGGEEVDDVLDVVVIGHFDDGMHVAEGEGDEGGGDALADVVDLVGIGPRISGGGLVLEGYL